MQINISVDDKDAQPIVLQAEGGDMELYGKTDSNIYSYLESDLQ